MYPDTIPWKVLSATASVGAFTPEWELDQVPLSSEETRSFTIVIDFATCFEGVPVIHLGLTGFDADQRDSPRLSLSAVDITPHGFTAVVSTWATTRLYSVEFNWLAIGA